ncbi:hypothetical protein [Ornithinimicrobium sp. LYQ103]|uniref:hypothetical protein n=1 Tax=Ornithinimicrobium sp. LYQ103 TaxID=3378796 RepID=UPI003854DE42
MITSDDILMALRVRGSSSEFALSFATGADVDSLASQVRDLESAKLVRRSPLGRNGWELAEAGERRVDDVISRLTTLQLRTLAVAYETFMVVDPLVKGMCSEWQGSAPRDTESTVRRMRALVEAAAGAFRDAPLAVARLQRYQERLEAAVEEVRGGDGRFVTHPHVDSFHNIWFEAHEEFLLLLGRERG